MGSLRQRPVTLREIAAKAGVSTAAVSLALRGSAQISIGLRKRVQALAEKMGYRPNPLLAAYQAQVRALKPIKFQAVLGWVNDWPDEKVWQRSYMKPLLDGARTRASELGYKLDEIWVPNIREDDPAGNFSRWERILTGRGIHGVILPFMNRQHHCLLPWQNFSVVSLGKYHSLVEESRIHVSESCAHHRVSADYAFDMRLAVTRLRDAGCRRIGLSIAAHLDAETDHAYGSSFSWMWSKWPAKERVPILFSDNVKEVKAWAMKHRPDAVICSHSDIRLALQQAKLSVPRDTRLIHLNVAPDVSDWSGIDRRMPLQGSAAVDLVTATLQRNERGAPPYAKEISIEGVWVEGKT